MTWFSILTSEDGFVLAGSSIASEAWRCISPDIVDIFEMFSALGDAWGSQSDSLLLLLLLLLLLTVRFFNSRCRSDPEVKEEDDEDEDDEDDDDDEDAESLRSRCD